MEEFLIVILQALLEFLFDVIVNVGADWPFKPDVRSLPFACFLRFLGGCALGGLSILLFRHTWIPFSALRMANLAAAPLSAAWLAQHIARERDDKYLHGNPRRRYWRTFWLTLGVVAVRFAFATRPPHASN